MKPAAFTTPIDWQQCDEQQRRELLTRPAISASDRITESVSEILRRVRSEGDSALREFCARFDKTEVQNLRVTAQQIEAACARLGDEVKQAMAHAVRNIETFHQAQQLAVVDIETQPGVRCPQLTRTIQSVGLYIPRGSGPRGSTGLTQAPPARLAGCPNWVL